VTLDLHPDGRVGLQVQVPLRRGRCAALGRHHQVATAVLPEDQRRAVLLPGAPPGGGQDQDGAPVRPVVPFRTIGLDVPLDVLLAEQHRRSSAHAYTSLTPGALVRGAVLTGSLARSRTRNAINKPPG